MQETVYHVRPQSQSPNTVEFFVFIILASLSPVCRVTYILSKVLGSEAKRGRHGEVAGGRGLVLGEMW